MSEDISMPDTIPILRPEEKGGSYTFNSQRATRTCTLMRDKCCSLLSGCRCLYIDDAERDSSFYAHGTLTEFPCPRIRAFYQK